VNRGCKQPLAGKSPKFSGGEISDKMALTLVILPDDSLAVTDPIVIE